MGLETQAYEGLPYEYHDEDCHVFDLNGLRFGWHISAHAQSVLSAGQKHHNSSPLASACRMVTNKDLKRKVKHNTPIEISTVLMLLQSS